VSRPFLFAVGILAGCSLPSRTVVSSQPDIRLRLLENARQQDQEFPDGSAIKLTHFSYVGTLETLQGTVYVVDRRAVIAGMLAPRGLNVICFFDASEQFLGKVCYATSRPLWCENGKVYLFGAYDGGAISEDESCNVIDLSAGFSNMRFIHQKAYGSSGGIADP